MSEGTRTQQDPSEGTAIRQDRTDDGRAATSESKPEKAPGTKPALPMIGARGMLRYLWRQLTSMQTALILLLLLALASVPGSILPQRNVDPGAVTEYLEDAGTRGEVLDAFGFFNVFGSPWFSAIYLLLFVSLVGCVVPRLRTLIDQLRSRPPKTPRRLNRFTGYTAFTPTTDERARTAERDDTSEDTQQQAERARDELTRQRYRVDLLEERNGAWSVTSERGYVREAGNLLFHIGMLGLLVTLALGNLFQWRGQITMVEGEGFTNSLARYDSFQSGTFTNTSMLPDFNMLLEDFEVSYEMTPGSQFGQPRQFDATVTMTVPGQEPETSLLQVNQPVSVGSANIYLLGNGYAPSLTFTDPEGTTVASGSVIALPAGDGFMTSTVVLKAPDAQPEQMALVGVLMPTQNSDGTQPVSTFPDAIDPALQFTVYTGDLGLDEGIPRNVYEVDVSTLEQMTDEKGEPFTVRLEPGQLVDLPGGGSVSFDGMDRFAAFDVEHNPLGISALIMSLIATGGLAFSLFVPRRRLWARFTPVRDAARGPDDGPGPVRVEVAGLARGEDHSLPDVVSDFAAFLGAPPSDESPSGAAAIDASAEPREPSRTAATRSADGTTNRRTTE